MRTEPKKSGCAKAFGIGCLVVIAVIAVVAVVGFLAVRGFVSNLVDTYTATHPSALPSVQVQEGEDAAILARVATFTNAVLEGRTSAELDLTARDINVLIQRHPAWTNLAGRVYVTIAGDQLSGSVNIPLDGVAKMVNGRWLSGIAVFRVGTTAGRLVVFMDSLTLNGKSPPDSFMDGLRAKNLAEEANRRPEVAALLEKLQSVAVRDGMLRIVSRPGRLPESPTP